MTQYLCCSLNMRTVTDHSFKCLERCRSRTNLLCQKPPVCVCVCVWWDLLWMLMGFAASDWNSAMQQTVCVSVCVCECVYVCVIDGLWACCCVCKCVIECVLMVNVIPVCVCVCFITVVWLLVIFHSADPVNKTKLKNIYFQKFTHSSIIPLFPSCLSRSGSPWQQGSTADQRLLSVWKGFAWDRRVFLHKGGSEKEESRLMTAAWISLT